MCVPAVNLYFTFLNLRFSLGGTWCLLMDGEAEVTDEMMELMEGEDMEFLDEEEEIVFTFDSDEQDEEDKEDETK
jgi:hypothetical protein